jgi:hypothetical protein
MTSDMFSVVTIMRYIAGNQFVFGVMWIEFNMIGIVQDRCMQNLDTSHTE